LGKGAGGDLQQRLQQLGKTGDEIRLLSEIERIITAHGLVEFRGTLSMLLDRMESAAFEVGVFGRVSSGKSSLLNYILQTDVLPVGVTPVTAIPTASVMGLLQKPELNLPKRSRKSFCCLNCLNLRRSRKIRETKSMSREFS
jgi:predicted GTPase